eukprot:gene22011-29069_t
MWPAHSAISALIMETDSDSCPASNKEAPTSQRGSSAPSSPPCEVPTATPAFLQAIAEAAANDRLRDAIPLLNMWGLNITFDPPSQPVEDNAVTGSWPPHCDCCRLCTGYGHKTYLCPNSAPHASVDDTCSSCGGPGHHVGQCTSILLPHWDPSDPVHSNPVVNPLPCKTQEICGNCSGTGHLGQQCCSTSIEEPSTTACARCGGFNHHKSSCPNPLRSPDDPESTLPLSEDDNDTGNDTDSGKEHSGHKQKWRCIGKLLGRGGQICRATWLEIRLGDKQKHGKWSSADENRLRLLVTEQIAACKEKEAAEMKLRLEQMAEVEGAVCRPYSNPSHYRDGINFEPISDSLGTRAPSKCFVKWYYKLSPSVFSSGEWDLGDDITLVRALQSAGYEWLWEVEWDRLVPNRATEQSKRRWRSMLKSLPNYLEKSFNVCVEELAEKYSSHRCRRVLEHLK